MGLPIGQKLVKSGSTWVRLCGTLIFGTAGWIYTIWSYMELSRPVVVQHQGLWPWPLIFKVKFWRCCISGMGGPIDMEQKGCESIGCYTHLVTLNYDLTHDLGPWFSRSNFEKVITQERDARSTWNERDESTECRTHVMTFNFDLTHDLELEFSTSNFEIAVSQEWQGRSTWNKRDMSR